MQNDKQTIVIIAVLVFLQNYVKDGHFSQVEGDVKIYLVKNIRKT